MITSPEHRAELIQQFSEDMVDGMDLNTLRAFVVDVLNDAHNQLDDAALIEKIQEFAPHLLDN